MITLHENVRRQLLHENVGGVSNLLEWNMEQNDGMENGMEQ